MKNVKYISLIRKSLIVISILICHNAFAQTYYCVNTMKYVQVGDNIAQVRAGCGAPTSSTTREEQVSTTIDVIQWIYHVEKFSENGSGFIPVIISFDQKTMLVTKINIAGSEVQSSDVCGQGKQIKVGDDQLTIRRFCSAPIFTNVSHQTVDKGKRKVTIWTYQVSPYSPQQTIMQFNEQGVLESIKTQ